ncbi:MAG: PIN domain-containing protein [Phycisphaeraceae bacterium]
MITESAELFLDTNILLHFQRIREIDWKTVAGARCVRLILCSPVLDELDKNKYNPKTADRARRADAEITQIEKAGGKVRVDVTLEVAIDDEEPTGNVDSAIIQCILTRMKACEATRVGLVSDDSQMRRRGEAKGVEVITLDEKWQRPVESEEARKLKQAERELQRLRSRLPKLRLLLSAAADDTPEEVVSFESSRPSPIDVESLMEDERARCRPLLETDGFAAEACNTYDSQLEEYFIAYRQYLKRLLDHREFRARTLRLTFWIANEGTLPAHNVRAMLTLPTRFRRVVTQEEVDGYLEPKLSHRSDREFDMLFGTGPRTPTVPERPKKPQPRSVHGLAFNNLSLSLPRDRLFFERSIPSVNMPDLTRTLDVGDDMVKLWVDKVTHNDHEPIGNIVAVFRTWEEVTPFPIEYEIQTDDHPDGFTGRALVRGFVQEPPSGVDASKEAR